MSPSSLGLWSIFLSLWTNFSRLSARILCLRWRRRLTAKASRRFIESEFISAVWSSFSSSASDLSSDSVLKRSLKLLWCRKIQIAKINCSRAPIQILYLHIVGLRSEGTVLTEPVEWRTIDRFLLAKGIRTTPLLCYLEKMLCSRPESPPDFSLPIVSTILIT